MKFPWHKYEEIPLGRRNTLQVFITNACNLRCNGCFARNVMGKNKAHISLEEYTSAVHNFIKKSGGQINLLGGEPFLHPNLKEILSLNKFQRIKTTIYTNGYMLDKYSEEELQDAKLRVSLYCKSGKSKSVQVLPKTNISFDANFMVSRTTTLNELLESAEQIEKNYNCNTFFISSIRELDNPRKEFFDDTNMTMNVIGYKELVHDFLNKYEGNMEIHVSKRGVFESTKTLPDTKCRFANYFIGEKIIQCPYDVVNLKFQKNYTFGERNCQQNNTCLMSKIKLIKI
jgi:organic radical activating enzyme